MFSDYRTFIITTYRQKRATNDLKPNLLVPNPSKLRAECELAYKERYDKKDDDALRMFFGMPKEGQSFAEHIRKFEVTKFKPLLNFLNGKIREPEDRTVELLAWLLDVPSRPYNSERDHATDPIVLEERPEETEERKIEELTKPKKKWMGIAALVLIVSVAIGTYAFWPKTEIPAGVRPPIPPPLTGNCMAWSQDRYLVIPCEQQKDHQGVLGIDSIRLFKFRRITDTLTMSESSVGKVWYFKNRDKVEYYTAPGYHPIDTNRWLKPLTTYIVRKYLQHHIHP